MESLGDVDDDVEDIMVSADGTEQKQGFWSLFGAVLIIANEAGQVIGYAVKSKLTVSTGQTIAEVQRMGKNSSVRINL